MMGREEFVIGSAEKIREPKAKEESAKNTAVGLARGGNWNSKVNDRACKCESEKYEAEVME